MIGNCFILMMLAVTAFLDFKNRIIPDTIHTVLLIVGAIMFTLSGINLFLQIIQGATVFFILIVIICIMEELTDNAIMGGGDIKLLGVLGFLMQYNSFFTMIVFLTAILLSFVIVGKIFNKRLNAKIAFAPFIFLAYTITDIYKFLLTFNGGNYV